MDDLVILSPKKSLEKEKKDFKRMKSMDDYILELSPKRLFEEERGRRRRTKKKMSRA